MVPFSGQAVKKSVYVLYQRKQPFYFLFYWTMTVTRKRFTSKIKFKVVCELLSGKKTQAEIASEYGVHPTQQNNWKKDFMER
jgi:Trp operon repressor